VDQEWRRLALLVLAALLLGAGQAVAENPFATKVVEFVPAPGQFVNRPEFNNPLRALGAPSGGGTFDADNSSIVSLGGFGGSITLAFDHTVKDDPLNPLGLDAIVFSNAVWSGGDPEVHFGELAVIEIAYDENNNGQPDAGEWYLIPGSHLDDPPSRFRIQMWDSHVNDVTFPPASASWIPSGYFGTWATAGFRLPESLITQFEIFNPSSDAAVEGIWGYAEYTPTLLLGDFDADNRINDLTISPAEFYTVPDDPFGVGISPGSGGGDAFDIAWAIDPFTGAAAELPGFDFIRVSNGFHYTFGIFGEFSAEIDAVADVAPDFTGDADEDQDIDLRDIGCFQECLSFNGVIAPFCEGLSRDETVIDLVEWDLLASRMTGPR